MSRVVATFHGPNYNDPDVEPRSIEVHDSVQAAAESLLERYQSNGHYPVTVRHLDGNELSVAWPVMEGCYLKVWMPYPNEDPDIFAQEAVTLIRSTDGADRYVYLVEHSHGRYVIENHARRED